MNNEKLQLIAEDIVGTKTLPADKFGNPLMILMIVGILVNIIRVIQECNKKETNKFTFYKKHIHQLSSYRSWFTIMRLKKILRQQLSKEDYKLYSQSLINAILNKGERITDEELLTLMEAANV